MTAVQELSTNHRQSGDTSWSDCLNLLRKGIDASAVQGVYETLKTRIGSLSGGPVPEHEFDDAMRLYSKNDKVASCSDELRTCGLWLVMVRLDPQGRSGGSVYKLPRYLKTWTTVVVWLT